MRERGEPTLCEQPSQLKPCLHQCTKHKTETETVILVVEESSVAWKKIQTMVGSHWCNKCPSRFPSVSILLPRFVGSKTKKVEYSQYATWLRATWDSPISDTSLLYLEISFTKYHVRT